MTRNRAKLVGRSPPRPPPGESNYILPPLRRGGRGGFHTVESGHFANLVLMDDGPGRKKAKRIGLTPLGVAGFLVRAKQRGMVNEVKPLLVRLRNEFGYRISDEDLIKILDLAGESS